MSLSKQIIWLLSIQVLVFSLLFSVFTMAREIYPRKVPESQTHIHWNLYVDKNIEPLYFMEIKQAAARWAEATNHIAELDVIPITSENRNIIRHDPDALVITIVTEDNPDIIRLDEDNNEGTVAFFRLKSPIPTLAYAGDRLTDDDFMKVTMHELGHTLKLEHMEGPANAGHLMYPMVGLMSNGITKEDLMQFCTIWHCDANKLKYEEESLHL